MKRSIFLLWLSVLLVLLAFGSSVKKSYAVESTWLHNGVTAHRGDSLAFPENTFPAFESAVELGADWIELDVYRTSDGRLVVTHDRTTGRVAEKDLSIAETTYEALTRLDMAFQFRKAHGLSKAECPRQKMPLLEEVLRWVQHQKKTRVSIQPKADCVGRIAAIVKQTGAERWVGFNDGNLRYMTQAIDALPETFIFWDRYRSDIDQDIKTARQRGFHALVLNRADVTSEKIRKIHDAGLKAGAWTVNDSKEMRRFLDWGIDRIYTDHPSLLIEVGREKLGKSQR